MGGETLLITTLAGPRMIQKPRIVGFGFMIRPRGIALIIVAIVVFVLAGVTRVGWLLLFDAVLWGTVVVSALMPWLASGSLSVRRRVVGWDGRDGDPGPMEGDAVQFEITVSNGGLLPCVFVALRYNCVGETTQPDRQHLFVAWLGRHRSVTSTTTVRFDRRGRYELPPVRAETSVPFGLFRRSRLVGQPTELVVLPRVYPVARLDMLGSTSSTELRPLRARMGEQITGSRSSVPGDPWQHIHWRNTARMAQPQIKEFENTRDASLAIAFDASQAGPEDREALEHAIKIAASVGDFVCRSGGAVRLLAGRPQPETTSRHHLLRELALLDASGEAALPVLLQEVPNELALLAIVRDSDEAGIRALTNLAQNQRRVATVVLRGFDSGSPGGDPSDELSRAGVYAVEGRPGDIPGALAALERTARLPGGPTDAVASSR